MVRVDVDVGRPLVHHLRDERVDLLRLELHVVAVHVEALLVRPAPHLTAVGIDERDEEHDHVVEQRAEVTENELA